MKNVRTCNDKKCDVDNKPCLTLPMQQCQCKDCEPQCPPGMCPSCLEQGQVLPDPRRQVNCYRVVTLPDGQGGWADTLTPVSADECFDAPAYMLDNGDKLQFTPDPDYYNGPQRSAQCPTVPRCTKLVWGVGQWSTERKLGWTTQEIAAFRSQVCRSPAIQDCDCFLREISAQVSFDVFMNSLTNEPQTPDQVTDDYARGFTAYMRAVLTCNSNGMDTVLAMLTPILSKTCMISPKYNSCAACNSQATRECMASIVVNDWKLMQQLWRIYLGNQQGDEIAKTWADNFLSTILPLCKAC